MEQEQSELTLEESMAQVMQMLPPVIHDYLMEGKYTPVAINLANKYKLRIDQSGILEREIALLLMGINNPDEFTKVLAEDAKLDEMTISNIVQDVNTQVFLPLRKAEELSNKQPDVLQTPAHIAPLPPKVAMPQVSRPSLAAPVSIKSINLLEDHEEPHIEIAQTPAIAVPQPAPKIVPPPMNLPGMMPPPVTSASTIQYPPLPKPTQPPAQVTVAPQAPIAAPASGLLERMTQPPAVVSAPTIPVAPAKPRSADPYREPIDEPVAEM